MKSPPGASGSRITTTTSTAEAGSLVARSGGGRSGPSQVYARGINPPEANALVTSIRDDADARWCTAEPPHPPSTTATPTTPAQTLATAPIIRPAGRPLLARARLIEPPRAGLNS
jgi:hypothetical protein